MDPEVAGTIAAAVVGAIGGGFWGRRSKMERDASSAKDLALAYGELVDDLRKGQEDLRKHVHRLDEQIMRRDDEIKSLRDELAVERADNRLLRDRIAALEAGRRTTDVTPA